MATAGNLDGDLREFVDSEAVVVRQHDAEHCVFELPDVAWPMISRQQSHRFRRDSANGLSPLGREKRQEWRASAAMSAGRSTAAAPRSETRAVGRTGPRGSALPRR